MNIASELGYPYPPAGECDLWAGAKSTQGYGVRIVKGKWKTTHREAWEKANGPIPKGLCVLHKCDNRLCRNTGHLFVGTLGGNNRDADIKRRSRLTLR